MKKTCAFCVLFCIDSASVNSLATIGILSVDSDEEFGPITLLGNSSLVLNLYDLCAHCHTFFCKPLDVHMSVGVGKKSWDVNLSKI
jgi:hypothetical protein